MEELKEIYEKMAKIKIIFAFFDTFYQLFLLLLEPRSVFRD